MTSVYNKKWLAMFLAGPQVLVLSLFFYLPIMKSIEWSTTLQHPFGGPSKWVGIENYIITLTDAEFYRSLMLTMKFMFFGSTLSVLVPLILALAVHRQVRMSGMARNLLVWPKAVAGASIGVVFAFIFNPFVGVFSFVNSIEPNLWNPGLNGNDAFWTIIIAHVWGGIPFNFIIFLGGLNAIPHSLNQAAAMDGASGLRRIWDIYIPLLTPQLFLSFVLEVTDSVVSAFALVASMTQGGPGGSTKFLVYKIYEDGFLGLDLSGASTQTVILTVFVLLVAFCQFLFLEKKVKYAR
ncbi:glycerol-3-phosphate transporter permease [Photobacterium rosenbergii]|uniref:sn-glycerol-3-phosphate transport system permease protein UgpA n=1 Tax=Photobacterium rosenbergii TaxID=294936 RepID=A0A2T3NMM1_9GAMM|nr:sugar ABC transporter permease [Photobacterium rosenbergii]PSW16713.1 glycerol-3-phosphate transporter permease [Photobacterium rosenbergii]